MKEKITRSSGNVFEDLGIPSEEAEYLFSIDTLVDMLARAGVHIKLVVGSSKRKLKVA